MMLRSVDGSRQRRDEVVRLEAEAAAEIGKGKSEQTIFQSRVKLHRQRRNEHLANDRLEQERREE